MTVQPTRTAALLVAGVLTLAAAGASASTAGAAPSSCGSRTNNSLAKLLECVDLPGVRAHQAALQAIADDNNGTRVSGSPGYDQSVAYVKERLGAAGWNVTQQDFQFQTFVSLAPSILEQVAPPPAGPVANTILSYSGSGDVTAAVTALPGPAIDPTPGCEAADFAGFVPGEHRPGLPRRVHLRDQGDQCLRRGRGRRRHLQQHGRGRQRHPRATPSPSTSR